MLFQINIVVIFSSRAQGRTLIKIRGGGVHYIVFIYISNSIVSRREVFRGNYPPIPSEYNPGAVMGWELD